MDYYPSNEDFPSTYMQNYRPVERPYQSNSFQTIAIDSESNLTALQNSNLNNGDQYPRNFAGNLQVLQEPSESHLGDNHVIYTTQPRPEGTINSQVIYNPETHPEGAIDTQIIYPTVRYQEIPVSHPMFQKQMSSNYVTEYVQNKDAPRKKRGRPPVNSRSPKRSKSLRGSASEGPFMQLLTDIQQDTLTQAISLSGIEQNKPEEYTTYTVSNDVGVSPVLGCTNGKDLLPTHEGKTVIPADYKVCSVQVMRTDDGYHVSAPSHTPLSEEDIKSIINAAMSNEIIYKAQSIEGYPTSTVSTVSCDSDLTTGSSTCTGSSHQISQENLLESLSSTSNSGLKAGNSHVDNEQLIEDDGPVPSVGCVSIVSTSPVIVDNSQ